MEYHVATAQSGLRTGVARLGHYKHAADASGQWTSWGVSVWHAKEPTIDDALNALLMKDEYISGYKACWVLVDRQAQTEAARLRWQNARCGPRYVEARD